MRKALTVEGPRSQDLDTACLYAFQSRRDVGVIDHCREPVRIRAEECELPVSRAVSMPRLV